LGRIDSEEGNDPVENLERLHVVVRLAAAAGADHQGIHGSGGGRLGGVSGGTLGDGRVTRGAAVGSVCGSHQEVGVGGVCGWAMVTFFRSTNFSDGVGGDAVRTLVNGNATLQGWGAGN